jgi:hypothetical protein
MCLCRIPIPLYLLLPEFWAGWNQTHRAAAQSQRKNKAIGMRSPEKSLAEGRGSTRGRCRDSPGTSTATLAGLLAVSKDERGCDEMHLGPGDMPGELALIRAFTINHVRTSRFLRDLDMKNTCLTWWVIILAGLAVFVGTAQSVAAIIQTHVALHH